VSGPVFVFIWYYKASGFPNILWLYLEYCLSCGEGFFFFVLRYFVSGVCLSIRILVSCFFILGVLGPWEFLWRAGSYYFCVCDSTVWSAGPVQFYLGTFLERMAGLYRFFPFLWLCCSGYGTVEMVRGVVRVSFRFLQFAVSSLGGRMSVVGLSFL
jgi:hypothetical protein